MSKIFITYKYGDTQVKELEDVEDEPTKARHYVDELQEILKAENHINKGEADNESLADFKDYTIESKLRAKIYDSSITIAIVSKGMTEYGVSERDQWMPWEIAYSLKEHTRDDRTSYTNALLAVVLPDEYGSYEYFIVENSCARCNSRTLKTDFLFQIMGDNMFNIKKPVHIDCSSHSPGKPPYIGDASYIASVKWDDFVTDVDSYISKAFAIHENIDDYDICKTVK